MAYNKTPFKMKGKSPFMKALVGKQNNLPDALKEKILASPAKQHSDDSGSFQTPEEMREREAEYNLDQRSTNARAARLERKAVRQDLRAQKQERRAANMKKRRDRKEKEKKTRAGKIISKVEEKLSSSPAKQMSKLKKKSPVKQDVTVGDLPDMAVQGAKKLFKKIGNIKLSTKEGQERRRKRKALRKKQKADKAYEKYSKKYDEAQKLKSTPAKKKNCKYKK
tara:strand:- start:14 stop:682 length:669 start_codon:yes stop_codon:yes gene_type:complete